MKIVILTGAGISAESGLKTFRDAEGLWENHKIEDVATPEAWERNPQLVQHFYNERRKSVLEAKPNEAHKALVRLEDKYTVQIITQNIDDLHERAGSKNVLHLHGELLKVRSTKNPNYILDWQDDLNFGDLDENKNQLRPHIVWFGEEVPALDEAITLTQSADYFAVIGTSLQVYPAAGLIDFTSWETPIFYIDPKPIKIPNLRNPLEVIPEVASKGVAFMKEKLLNHLQ